MRYRALRIALVLLMVVGFLTGSSSSACAGGIGPDHPLLPPTAGLGPGAAVSPPASGTADDVARVGACSDCVAPRSPGGPDPREAVAGPAAGVGPRAVASSWSDLNLSSPTKCELTLDCGPSAPGYALFDDAATGTVVLLESISRADTYNSLGWDYVQGSWTPSWSSGNPAYPPPFAAVAYDPTGGYALSFGGIYSPINDSTDVENSNWTFEITSGGATQLLPHHAPPAPAAPTCDLEHCDANLMYDPVDNEMVLLEDGPRGVQTWAFAEGDWTNITAGVQPPSDLNAQMTWDTADQEGVLFGYQGYSATWTFSDGTWTNLTSTLAVSPSTNGQEDAMAYDPALGEVVLFGGSTWAFESGVWTNISSAFAPPAWTGAAATYSSELGGLLLFEGPSYASPPPVATNYTWFYGSTTTLASVAVSPPTATVTEGLTFDFAAQAMCNHAVSCAPDVAYTWALSGDLGTLNVTAGAFVAFTAGSEAGEVGLYANATLGDDEVASAPAMITISSSVPLLYSVSIAPASATVDVGGSQLLNATPSCTGGPCPDGTTYSWTLTNGLGTLSNSFGATTSFLAGYSLGVDTVFVNATLNGVTVDSAGAPVTIVASTTPTLSSVLVTATATTLGVGGSAGLVASPVCTGGTCPVGLSTYQWSLTNDLGTLNSTTGAWVTFLAGSTAGTDAIYVNATLSGVTVMSAATPILISSSLPTPSSVDLSPTSATLTPGGSQSFSAAATCTSPCPSGLTYSWSMSKDLGTLNRSTGRGVMFTAGASTGNTTLEVVVSLNGVSRAANATITIQVPSSSPGTKGFLGLPGNDGYVVLGGIAALGAVAVAVALLRRDRKSSGTTGKGTRGSGEREEGEKGRIISDGWDTEVAEEPAGD